MASPPSRSKDGRLPELFKREEWRELARIMALTPRQWQIARLICRGLTTDEMSRSLRIAPATVRMHKQELFKRLGIRDKVGVPVRLVLAQRRIARRGKTETALTAKKRR